MAVNEWLLSMARSYKSGSLSKSIRQVERSIASGIKLDKAILKLADTQTLSFEEAVSSLQSTSALPKDIAECQDVTASFLAKDPQVDLLGSNICIHKGNYNTFASTTAANPNISAILSGKNAWNDKFHVTQMVLSIATPIDMLQCEKIIARCEVQRLKPCGLILVGEAGQLYEENNVKSTLEPFKPGHPTLILISIDCSQKAIGIYFASQLNAEIGIVQRVSLSWVAQSRAEGSQYLSYNICHLSELGVSHYDKVTEKIALVVVKQVQTKMSSGVDASAKHGPLVLFRKVNVMAEHYCGWHSLLANDDLTKYDKIPRSAETTTHLNSRILQEEEANGRELHEATCEVALRECDLVYTQDILRIQKEDCFAPQDLYWISQVMGFSIRCTCFAEAGLC